MFYKPIEMILIMECLSRPTERRLSRQISDEVTGEFHNGAAETRTVESRVHFGYGNACTRVRTRCVGLWLWGPAAVCVFA